MSGTQIEYFKLHDDTILEGRMHWNDDGESWLSLPLSKGTHLIRREDLLAIEEARTTPEICIRGGAMCHRTSKYLVNKVFDELDKLGISYIRERGKRDSYGAGEKHQPEQRN